MTGRVVLLTLTLFLTVVPAFAAAPDFAGMEVQPYDPPNPAPDFTLPNLQGQTVHLADLQGKVVMLFFWATWCPDCREELPSVNKLYTDFRRKGLEVLLVNFREDLDLVRRTVRERGYVAPVLFDRSGDVTGKTYGVWAPPTMYFVDRRGRLIGRAVGPRGWDSPAARKFIEALLELSPKP